MLDRSVIERYPWIEPRSWQLAMLREGPHDWIGIWEALAHESVLILDLTPDQLDDLRRQLPAVLDLLRPAP